jgi:hypothetical protein
MWSRLFDKCISCGKTESPHGGHGVCNRCRALKFYREHKEHCKEVQRNLDRARRKKVLVYYSGIVPKCACCGIEQYEFLSLDHINGGGYKHRKEIGNFGRNFYKWIIKNNFPSGFRVLCHNCNLAKGFYGKCPHEL